MVRLPTPGSDDGVWGQLLNDYLAVSHNTDGTLTSGVVANAQVASGAAIAQSKISNLTTDLAAKEDVANKGAASGYAPLNSSSKVPVANLPMNITSAADDPAMFGLAMWTTSLYAASLSYGPSAQTFLAVLARAGSAVTVNKLGAWIVTAGSGAGAGINGMALYSESGTRLAVTGDMTAAFQTTGYVEGTLTSSYTLAAGTSYYIVFLNNFSSAPVLATNGSTGTYPIIRGHYASVVAFSQTSFPASITPSSLTMGNLPVFMTAGS